MNKLLSVFTVVVLSMGLNAFAQAQTPIAGEAEAGAVLVSGNNETESYAAKAKAVYTHEQNILTGSGRYLKTDSDGIESALNWEAGVRYERTLTDYLSLFAGQKAESDIYNGYIQRDSTDLGLKYYLYKSDTINWTAEAGYRYQKTMPTVSGVQFANMGRVYSEYTQKLNETLSFKYWIEYLPNFTDSEAYLVNTEASLNVMLNKTFSLKMAYLLQYQNIMPAGNDKYATSTTTMNLVAKF